MITTLWLDAAAGMAQWGARFESAASFTVIKTPRLDAWTAEVAQAMGMTPVIIKFVLTMYLCYLLALPNRSLPSATVRHAYALVAGVFVLQFCFGVSWLHLLFVSTVCYATIAATQAMGVLAHWRHWLTAVFSFSYLTALHLYRYLFTHVDAASVDYLVVQMVLTIKLYSFAYNVYDGTVQRDAIAADIRKWKAAVDAAKGAGERSKAARMHGIMVDRAARSIPALPTLLEYYGYVFNFTTVLVGPGFEVSEYLRSQRRPYDAAVDPSRFTPAFKDLLFGTTCMVAKVLATPYLDVNLIYQHALDATMPLWYKLGYAHLAFVTLRLAYYFVWRVAEGASVLAGYGYRSPGLDDYGEPRPADWDGVTNVHVLECETAKGITHAIRHWNLHTQSFLERYIFLRAPRAYSINKWITFFASAFWHGVFPGYYLGFMSVPPVQESSKYFFSVLRPLVTHGGKYDKKRPEYRIYAFFRFAITHLTLDYFLSSFAMYDLHRCTTVWAGWYYYGHVGAALMLLVALVANLAAPAVEDKGNGTPSLLAPTSSGGGRARSASGAGSGGGSAAGPRRRH